MSALNINEMFYSLQGEGERVGEPSIFIRLQGCSAKNACYASGVLCDTEFESGKMEYLDIILKKIKSLSSDCTWIVWTGGEPADQLNELIVKYFKDRGFNQAIETSGVRKIPENLDWVTISPKVAEHVLEKNFPQRHDGYQCDEIKYVRHSNQTIPKPSLRAKYYYIQPHSDGSTLNDENVKHCIKLCKDNPDWRLSIQQHKMLNIL